MRARLKISIVVFLAAACAPTRVTQRAATMSSNPNALGPADPDKNDQSWRSVKPAVEPLRAVALPSVERHQLENGVSVYLVANHEVPLVLARVLVSAGTCSETPGKAGLANFLTTLLSTARAHANGLPLREDLEQRGGTVQFGTSSDFSFIGIEALTADWERSLSDLVRVIQHPLIDAKDFDRERAATLAEIRKTADLGAQLSIQALRFVIDGQDNPCGAPTAGTAKSINRLTLQDVLSFHRRYYLPANYTVLVVGDFDRGAALKLLNDTLGRPQKSGVASRGKARSRAPTPPRFLVIDRPGAGLANFAIGHLGPSFASEDWFAANVMTRALGGLYFSRITKSLRMEKGYTYGANFIDYTVRRGKSIVSIRSGVGIDVGGVTVAEIVKQIRGIIDAPPRDEELERAKNSMANGMLARLQTNSQIAGLLQEIAASNLPAYYLNQYYEKLQRVTSEDVARAARQFLKPEELSIVVVGPSERLERDPQLRSLGDPEVLTIDELFEGKTAAKVTPSPSRGRNSRSAEAGASNRP
jgi:zinc protease